MEGNDLPVVWGSGKWSYKGAGVYRGMSYKGMRSVHNLIYIFTPVNAIFCYINP